jgi:hypothetical protein
LGSPGLENISPQSGLGQSARTFGFGDMGMELRKAIVQIAMMLYRMNTVDGYYH